VDALCAPATEAIRKANPASAPVLDTEQLRVAIVPRVPCTAGNQHTAQRGNPRARELRLARALIAKLDAVYAKHRLCDELDATRDGLVA
jgi:hypothetical protein